MKKFLSAVTALSICAVPAFATTDDEIVTAIAIDDPVPCVIADLPSDLVDFTAEAADAGILTISNGGDVSGDDVTTYALTITVVLGEAYMVVEEEDPHYAVIGNGTLGYVPGIQIDEGIIDLIIESGTDGVQFWLVDPTVTILDQGDPVIASSQADLFTISFDADTGIVTVWSADLPEPSMFGVFFGLGAIGLVATRRRRRRA